MINAAYIYNKINVFPIKKICSVKRIRQHIEIENEVVINKSGENYLMLSVNKRQGFTFKQFFVAHDKCAMKVTTDSIILGAWIPLSQRAISIIDIGTGSGLLSLMLAQRCQGQCKIDAIEIDKQASEQAKQNVQLSPWANNIRVFNQDINEFYQNYIGEPYELIISNPPYFNEGSLCRSSQRQQARYTTSLDQQSLLSIAEQLISAKGRFCLALPYNIALEFKITAKNRGWHFGHTLLVRDSYNKSDYLMLLELSRYKLEQKQENIVLRNSQRQYTDEFRQLTKPFYLDF